MERDHHYSLHLNWTGNTGAGTRDQTAYARDYRIAREGKPTIDGSSDPSFRGDGSRWNPEDLLIGSIAACHQLWYLGLCAGAGIVVTAYEDDATGTMREEASGAGQFSEVVLRPRVTLAPGSDVAAAERLHERAHRMCFIARSVNFPVRHEAVTAVEET